MSVSTETRALADHEIERAQFDAMGDHGEGYDPNAEPLTAEEKARCVEARATFRELKAARCREAEATISK